MEMYAYIYFYINKYLHTYVLIYIHTTYIHARMSIHLLYFLSGKDTQAASKEQAMKAANEAMETAKHEYEKVCMYVCRLPTTIIPVPHTYILSR